MLSLFTNTDVVRKDALLSKCEKYRYWLTHTWDDSKPVICWCMLNPSTATAEVDDPTIRKCMSFSQAWGAGGIVVVNLFAFRATDPADLIRAQHPVAELNGPGGFCENPNDYWIVRKSDTHRLIAAWGRKGAFMGRGSAVMELLGKSRVVECLGVNADGTPLHPLYVRGDTVPQRYFAPGRATP